MNKKLSTELAAHIRNKLMLPAMRISVALTKLREALHEIQALAGTINNDFGKLIDEKDTDKEIHLL